MLNELKKKRMISDGASSILKVALTGSAQEFLHRLDLPSTREKYPPELRAFALTLHFYSAKAYKYVRKTFACNLPHPSIIRKWYRSIDDTPGFTKEAFSALKIKAEETQKKDTKIKCVLIMDEIAIKKHIEWDHTQNQFSGNIVLGTDLDDDELPPAKEVLVFMANAVNGNWKVPIGYFLINGLSVDEKANLVTEALHYIHETGVEVVSITFDGTSCNIAAANALGANLSFEDMVHYFPHPVTNEPVEAENYIIPLKTTEEAGSVLTCKRKTWFLGFLVTHRSIKSIFQSLCENGNLKFLLTYKFSQDHLELFFCVIRSHGGHNNNPTANLFKHAFVRLLTHNEIMTSDSANCIVLDSTSTINVGLTTNSYLNTINERSIDQEDYNQWNVEETAVKDHNYCTTNAFRHQSQYPQDVIGYVAGFVVKKLKKSVKYADCLEALTENSISVSKLLLRKNLGDLYLQMMLQSYAKSPKKFLKLFLPLVNLQHQIIYNA
ncbi:hypothetical protein JTE90_019951 [Oedothorax gibbosus]|uniref:THAP domain-containing protein 9 n=1 Tax=Oedothorax gibbosus TaxID=931172 RepID=A0AAV6UT44_9ARAC|nr:hypothetical protein JTE90_019951 [Oedothorax gibbosus]